MGIMFKVRERASSREETVGRKYFVRLLVPFEVRPGNITAAAAAAGKPGTR